LHLVQILLPVTGNDGQPFPREQFEALGQTLFDRFGGVTVYARSPAEGFWAGGEQPARDDIVIVEVMAETLDRDWWRDKRQALERDFRQEEVVIRAQEIERL
jgi:hypothetical protein